MPLVVFKNDNYVNTEFSNRRENILGNVWLKRFQLIIHYAFCSYQERNGNLYDKEELQISENFLSN